MAVASEMPTAHLSKHARGYVAVFAFAGVVLPRLVSVRRRKSQLSQTVGVLVKVASVLLVFGIANWSIPANERRSYHS